MPEGDLKNRPPKTRSQKGRATTAPTRRSTADGGDTVRSVQRAFTLLQCLSPSRPAMTLTDFSQATGLATSTVQRFLNTLESAGVLRRLGSGEYTFGSVALQIAVAALDTLDLHGLVGPHLERLSAETGETANFGVLNEQGEVLYLRHAFSDRPLRHAGWLGRTIPAVGTAIGSALRGETDARGVVSTRDTIEPDLTAVAAPILGPGGSGGVARGSAVGEVRIEGALSVTGPTFRIDDVELARFQVLVAAEAAALTTSIGGTWPYRQTEASGSGPA